MGSHTIDWGHLSQVDTQILINRSASDRATAGDLPLPQSQLVSESQDFFQFSHGQPFHWQCGFLHFPVEPHCLRRCPASFALRNCSEMIPATIPTTGEKWPA